ncbi:MAG: flagellar biosynthesis protein FliQ [Clostridiales bacterium]|nr:flagellar biosynthesis protein FliQ [Clostridiales bacterium]
MSQAEVLTIMQTAIYTVILAAAPMLVVAIIVGLLVSVFQATTQINEQTLAFVPKIIAILLSLVVFGSFILTTLMNYIIELYSSINLFIT